jgi:hypothetical protein
MPRLTESTTWKQELESYSDIFALNIHGPFLLVVAYFLKKMKIPRFWLAVKTQVVALRVRSSSCNGCEFYALHAQYYSGKKERAGGRQAWPPSSAGALGGGEPRAGDCADTAVFLSSVQVW